MEYEKIPKNILKEMGYVDDKEMFIAIVLTNYLFTKKKISMLRAIYIACNNYEVEKSQLTQWMVKLEYAFNTVNHSNSTPQSPPSRARSVEKDSAKCTDWEQKMSELEAVVLP